MVGVDDPDQRAVVIDDWQVRRSNRGGRDHARRSARVQLLPRQELLLLRHARLDLVFDEGGFPTVISLVGGYVLDIAGGPKRTRVRPVVVEVQVYRNSA